jgi:AcrR family transcriptional regulator
MSSTTERTRRQIIHSFKNVLQAKRFSAITVQDICEDALIHRTTFYRYYEDKYHLLKDFIYQLAEELTRREKGSEADVFRLLVDYVEENRTLLEHALLDTDSQILFKSLVEIAAGLIREQSKSRNDPLSEKLRRSRYPDVVCDMYATAFITILQKWISGEYKYDKEDILNIFTQVMLD